MKCGVKTSLRKDGREVKEEVGKEGRMGGREERNLPLTHYVVNILVPVLNSLILWVAFGSLC